MSESDFCRRQILTSIDGPRAKPTAFVKTLFCHTLLYDKKVHIIRNQLAMDSKFFQ